jgi:hypothetical protein
MTQDPDPQPAESTELERSKATIQGIGIQLFLLLLFLAMAAAIPGTTAEKVLAFGFLALGILVGCGISYLILRFWIADHFKALRDTIQADVRIMTESAIIEIEAAAAISASKKIGKVISDPALLKLETVLMSSPLIPRTARTLSTSHRSSCATWRRAWSTSGGAWTRRERAPRAAMPGRFSSGSTTGSSSARCHLRCGREGPSRSTRSSSCSKMGGPTGTCSSLRRSARSAGSGCRRRSGRSFRAPSTNGDALERAWAEARPVRRSPLRLIDARGKACSTLDAVDVVRQVGEDDWRLADSPGTGFEPSRRPALPNRSEAARSDGRVSRVSALGCRSEEDHEVDVPTVDLNEPSQGETDLRVSLQPSGWRGSG